MAQQELNQLQTSEGVGHLHASNDRRASTSRQRTRRTVIGLGCTGLMLAFAGLAPAASALDSSSIRLAAMAVNEGSKIGVEIPNLWQATSCSLQLNGPRKGKPVTVKTRNSGVKTSLDTKGLPPGPYVVRANCGKDGKATSSSFAIVAKGAPTQATCDVADRGFSAGARGETTYGVVVANRSTVLTATSVKLAVAFLDGAGNTLGTYSDYVMDIAPGENAFVGAYETAANVASIRVDALCDSTMKSPTPRLRGQAQTIQARDSSFYPVTFGGSIPNPFNFIISGSSRIGYITRNAAGAITGGGTSNPDAFIPIGTTGTWNEIDVMYPENVATVEWVMDTRSE